MSAARQCIHQNFELPVLERKQEAIFLRPLRTTHAIILTTSLLSYPFLLLVLVFVWRMVLRGYALTQAAVAV